MASNETLQVLPGAELLGYGFNIFGNYNESSKTYPVLDKGQPSTYNYLGTDFQSYSNLNITLLDSTESSVQVFSSRTELESSFAENAGINTKTDTFLAGTFSGEVNECYSSISNQDQDNYYVWSKTNKKLWCISGGSPNIMQNEDIKSLPNKFDPLNPEPFFRVIQKYGAYYISEVYVGASLHYYESIEQSFCSDQQSASANATIEYNSLFTSVKASASAEWSKLSQNWTTNRQSTCKVVGGVDPGLGAIVSPSGSGDNISFNDKYNSWLSSVNEGNGVPVHFTLAPIYNLFADGNQAQAFQEATHAYLCNNFLITSNQSSPSIIIGGKSLIPQNSFPTQTQDILNPSIWVVVVNRQNKNIEFNLLLPLMASTWSGFPVSPETLDQADYENRIFYALNKYQASNNYLIFLTTYDLGAYAISTVNELTTSSLINFLTACGGGDALETWKSQIMQSYSGFSAYVLIGVIGAGANQGMDKFSSKVSISGGLIPSLDSGNALYKPQITGNGSNSGYSSSDTILNSVIQLGNPNFKLVLTASSSELSQISLNDNNLSPQNGFPIVPQGAAFNGLWIVLVEKATGNLIYSVMYDNIFDHERIFNSLSLYANSNSKYVIGLVSTAQNAQEVFVCPINTRLGQLLLNSGATNQNLQQWQNDQAHSSSVYSGVNYAMVGILNGGANQNSDVYHGVVEAPNFPQNAIISYTNH
jgi:hypothetical protein